MTGSYDESDPDGDTNTVTQIKPMEVLTLLLDRQLLIIVVGTTVTGTYGQLTLTQMVLILMLQTKQQQML